MADGLRLIDLGERLAQLQELPAQGGVHLPDKLVDHMVEPLHLRLCFREDEMLHALPDRREGALHRLPDAGLQLHADVAKGGAEKSGLVLHIAGLPHMLIQRPAHDHLGKSMVEIIHRAGGRALSGAEEDVEQQGANQAGDGGPIGKGHAGDHGVNRGHGGLRAVQVQIAQAAHQPDEGTQDPQACQHARDHLGQLEVRKITQDGLVVDVILHITGQPALVKLLGVGQEARPLLLHGAPQIQGVLPIRPSGLIGLKDRQVVNAPAKSARGAPQGKDAFAQPHQKGDKHRAVDHQVNQAAGQGLHQLVHIITAFVNCIVTFIYQNCNIL